MPSPLAPWDEIALTVTAGNLSATVSLGNPSAVGLFVPPLSTATTVTLQVSDSPVGFGSRGLVNGSGSALLALPSSSGGVAIGSVDLGAVLGYPYLKVVLGAAQAGDVTFYLQRKMLGIEEV